MGGHEQGRGVLVIVVGVDPGSTGALVALSHNGLRIAAWLDMPVINKEVNAPSLAEWLETLPLGDTFAVLEKAHAWPGQGVTSVFTLGLAYGTLKGVLGALDIPYTEVLPDRWKRDMHLAKKKTSSVAEAKAASRLAATNAWPSNSDLFKRVKDHGRAEAALIAKWGVRHISAEIPSAAHTEETHT
jgi:crossover junction endodeoxyribonuclease RuvC